MNGPAIRIDLDSVASTAIDAIRTAEDRTTPGLRRVRKELSSSLASQSGADVIGVAHLLLARDDTVPRWFAYELLHHHPGALRSLDRSTLLELGRGIGSWGDVDSFACYLTGVAWRRGQIGDDAVHEWARSGERWWRRAALVSTVPLNSKARGGAGDPERTIAVCEILAPDRDDMVVKAMSWALRELAKRDPEAVRSYVDKSRARLAPRVVREVRNKLRTGLKNPPARARQGGGVT